MTEYRFWMRLGRRTVEEIVCCDPSEVDAENLRWTERQLGRGGEVSGG